MLEADGVVVEFTTRSGAVARALDGVDVRVRPGEVLALVGESGSGKTTLARTLIGLERPVSGEVRWDGAELDYSGRGLKELRRRVQMVLQDASSSLNPRHTVYDSVAEGLRLHGLVERDPERRTETFTQMGGEGVTWGCGRPRRSSCATRTSSPVGSDSAS